MEETVNPITQEGAGFEPTRVPQFTIFLENRVGQLNVIVRLLEETEGKIAALSIQESADTSLVRVICTSPDAARVALKEADVSYTETEVLAVELPRDEAHPLVALCNALLAAEINIHYAYPLLARPRGPSLALYVEDPTLASQILIRKGFRIIGASDFLDLNP